MTESTFRRHIKQLVLAGVAAGVMTAAATAGVSATPSFADWFRYGEEAREDWAFTAFPGDGNRLTITPVGASQSDSPHKLLVLYPKPSSAYDVCMTKILSVFADKNIDAELTVINFSGDKAKGQAALSLARSEDYDLIFSMGSRSTAFLHEAFLGGDVPVVSVCSKDPVILGQMADYEPGSGSTG